MDDQLQPGRDIAAPLIVAGDPVPVPGLDPLQQVAAHQITAIVRLSKSLQPAVDQCDRLEQFEQQLSLLRQRLNRGGPRPTTSVHSHLIVDNRAENHDGHAHAGSDKPEFSSGHHFSSLPVRTHGRQMGLVNTTRTGPEFQLKWLIRMAERIAEERAGQTDQVFEPERFECERRAERPQFGRHRVIEEVVAA